MIQQDHPHADSPNLSGGDPSRPGWITSELIQFTLDTWQPHYAETLSEQDAVEMLLTVGNLYRVLLAGETHEQLQIEQAKSQAA